MTVIEQKNGDKIPFCCPKCQGNVVVEILGGEDLTVATKIKTIGVTEIEEYEGDQECEGGSVIRYQCWSCGYRIFEDANDIMDDVDDPLDAIRLLIEQATPELHTVLSNDPVVDDLAGNYPHGLLSQRKPEPEEYIPAEVIRAAGDYRNDDPLDGHTIRVSPAGLRPIELVRCNDDRTWDTVMVEIPVNTDRGCLEKVARDYAEAKYGRGVYSLYNSYEDSCPATMRSEVMVKLSFDLDEITVGSEKEQIAAVIEVINLSLQREPFGLGARLDESA